MIPVYPNIDESRRIAFFDRLLSYGTDELQEVMEAEEIIWKLKGKKPDDSTGIIRKLVENNNHLTNELIMARSNISTLQADLYMIGEDFKKLTKAVSHLYNQPQAYSHELNELKQKLNIY